MIRTRVIDLLPQLQAAFAGPAVLSVSEAAGHIKSLLDDDPTLADCWVRGEVSDPRTYSSGHTYFTLKDGGSQLKCVLFRQRSRGLEPLQHGRQYVVRGAISVYEQSGVYQLYVVDYRPVGIGELYAQFERLKARLEAEGLFAPERKRPLPGWPQRIGIATSAQGAVLHDLRTIIERRYPLVELVLAPCAVQGADAVRSIAASVRALDLAGVDVVIVARGGGSIEDLWAFNDERVARAIVACSVPVVSAVGHETDFTIADFVADLRAPTPSAAGELIVPNIADLARELTSLATRAERAMQAQLWLSQNELLDREARLRRAMNTRVQRLETRLSALDGRLQALSPLAVLQRGYAVVRDAETGHLIRNATQVQARQPVEVLLAGGHFTAVVRDVSLDTPHQSPSNSQEGHSA